MPSRPTENIQYETEGKPCISPRYWSDVSGLILIPMHVVFLLYAATKNLLNVVPVLGSLLESLAPKNWQKRKYKGASG